MRIVIGIGDDSVENHRTINFASRIGLLNSELLVVFVLERMTAMDGILGTTDFINNAEGGHFWAQRRAWAEERLEGAKRQIEKAGGHCEVLLLNGAISNELVRCGREFKADLLVIGSSDKGAVEGIMIGSVGRKLLVASECSFLIVKSSVTSKHLKVVVATDHSAYANQSFLQLLGFPPAPFDEVIVSSVICNRSLRQMERMKRSGEMDPELSPEINVQRKNQELAEKLAPIGGLFRTQVLHGDVPDALEEMMKAERADLLIIAAQGHGFIERLFIGSTSMKLALAQKKSVLILRKRRSLGTRTDEA